MAEASFHVKCPAVLHKVIPICKNSVSAVHSQPPTPLKISSAPRPEQATTSEREHSPPPPWSENEGCSFHKCLPTPATPRPAARGRGPTNHTSPGPGSPNLQPRRQAFAPPLQKLRLPRRQRGAGRGHPPQPIPHRGCSPMGRDRLGALGAEPAVLRGR